MDDFDPSVSEDASVQKRTLSASVSQSDSTSGTATLTTAATPSSAPQPAILDHDPVKTRSGRISLPPALFKDYVDISKKGKV